MKAATISPRKMQESKDVEPLPGVGEAKKPLTAPIESWSYTLRSEGGGWLAQVVLTSDGMFSAVSDWGNFSYAWRAFGGNRGVDFRDFLAGLGVDYFGQKMVNGMAYVAHSRKIESACHKFTQEVLPVLQATLKSRPPTAPASEPPEGTAMDLVETLEAIRGLAQGIQNISWGYDGDCGAGERARQIENLVESALASSRVSGRGSSNASA